MALHGDYLMSCDDGKELLDAAVDRRWIPVIPPPWNLRVGFQRKIPGSKLTRYPQARLARRID
jgi:hypothetical protein